MEKCKSPKFQITEIQNVTLVTVQIFVPLGVWLQAHITLFESACENADYWTAATNSRDVFGAAILDEQQPFLLGKWVSLACAL